MSVKKLQGGLGQLDKIVCSMLDTKFECHVKSDCALNLNSDFSFCYNRMSFTVSFGDEFF